jgi:16S rRNA processing protein RimM
MTQKPQRISVAKIATAHGVRGLVKLQTYLEDPQSLNDTPLYTSENGPVTLTLNLKNQAGRNWIASVNGVTERNAAEALRHTTLWMDKTALPAPAEGEYFIADLIGLTAVDASGKIIGTIKAVEDFGATPLLDIKPENSASFYLPFTDECVPKINMAEKKVTVFIPEGLI